ncbi:MAG: UvrB/UvrC motif-containing protein [Candidatus Omnitrophica bacterium]|nr:UvrB/UvrC motif-containing protein [Candidatus Omnitrophota bacterium]
MLCNVCGKSEASIHLTEIVNSQMLELHLCETCAQEKSGDLKTQFSFNELLNDLNSMIGLQKKEESRCRGCGLTYEEFAKSGRLGCPECYEDFSKPLTSLIKRVQKGIQHTGKKPGNTPTQIRFHIDLKDLQERLRKSIQMEEFEEAARIRDQIKQLETQIKKGPGGKSDV